MVNNDSEYSSNYTEDTLLTIHKHYGTRNSHTLGQCILWLYIKLLQILSMTLNNSQAPLYKEQSHSKSMYLIILYV